MSVKTRIIEYQLDGVVMEGVLAFDDSAQQARPGILVSHAWGGCSEFEIEKAKQLAQEGYVALALDVYGKGKRGTSMEENEALMNEVLADRSVLQARMKKAHEVLQDCEECDQNNTAAIGFCFGGLCVLDLARSGEAIKGVVPIHGLFTPPSNITKPEIKAKIQALHGWEDPLATPQNVQEFAIEMTKAKADWQLHAFGNTYHAFTNPAANVEGTMMYNAAADQRSWILLNNFLTELFA
ncbi:MAG: dienelactone hydrolase family protein [bacterium]